jgi:predicted phage tail protein
LQTQLDTRIAFLQRLEIEEGTSLDRRINIIELEAKKRQDAIRQNVADTKLANEQILLDEAQTQKAIQAEREKSKQKAIDDALQIAQAVADTLGSIIELQGIQSQRRVEEITATSEAERLAIEESSASEIEKQRKLEALRLRTEQKIAAEKRKQAVIEKQAAIFQAVLGTAVAIARAVGPVQKAIAAAAGLAQIAIIASTPIPKFKKGGPVGGRSHEAGGTLIEAEKGEYVVNKSSVARHRQALDAMNTSSAAFRKFIDEKYVRPAIAGYAMNSKRDGITVNASLNSKSMEKELKGLRKDMRNKNTVINFNGSDSRYSWQQN